jgi:hypothetical protein
MTSEARLGQAVVRTEDGVQRCERRRVAHIVGWPNFLVAAAQRVSPPSRRMTSESTIWFSRLRYAQRSIVRRLSLLRLDFQRILMIQARF